MKEKTILSYQSEGFRLQMCRKVLLNNRTIDGYVIFYQVRLNRRIIDSGNEKEMRIRFFDYVRGDVLQLRNMFNI